MSEELFQEYLKSLLPENAKRTRSALINKEYSERIVNYLKGGADGDRNFRHRVKVNKFELLDLPEAGLRDILVMKVEQVTVA